MELLTTSFTGYDICSLKGELKINEIPAITTQFFKYTQADHGIDLVFDLSQVTFIDSAGIRLLINLNKRLEGFHRKFYLLKPSEQVWSVLKSVNLDKVFAVIEDYEKIQKCISAGIFEAYQPFAYPEGDQRRLRAICAVCGSSSVMGYLVDPNVYEWKWVEDDAFPTSFLKGNPAPMDVFKLLPIVCIDCCTCTINPALFHAADNEKITVHSRLDEESKVLLAKSIKKRKKILETAGLSTVANFRHPREKTACYLLYILAESCAHAMAVSRLSANEFTIGYLNYLALRYATTEQKPELINNCRTWLTQLFHENKDHHIEDLAKAYFILINASLSTDKVKDAVAAFKDFQNLIEKLPPNLPTTGIDSPHFWFSQAHHIWQHEIDAKSHQFRV